LLSRLATISCAPAAPRGARLSAGHRANTWSAPRFAVRGGMLADRDLGCGPAREAMETLAAAVAAKLRTIEGEEGRVVSDGLEVARELVAPVAEIHDVTFSRLRSYRS
jgi:hypothetical protein